MLNFDKQVFDSIIFDLDGTLWDASETCTMVWNESLKESGNGQHALTRETVQSFSGLKIDKILEQYFPYMAAAGHKKLLGLYEKNERRLVAIHGGRLYPDMKEILQRLSLNYRLFIVSNCLNGYIGNFLDYNGFHSFFLDVECSGNTGLPKSDNIRMILERNQLRRAVYVGDTVWDQEAAAINQLPFIYAAYGFGKVLNAGHFIGQPRELLQLLPA